jgi:histidinol dehydrogenase
MTEALITRLDAVAPNFEAAFARLLISPAEADPELVQTVSQILRSVASEGDAALLQLTNELDQREAPTAASLRVQAQAMEEAVAAIDAEVRTALERAAERIRVFHERQLASSWQFEDGEGNVLGQRISALDRVGVYVPGGRASYPSSVLMNAIPAKVAGVAQIVMVSPAPGGDINPVVLAAAALAGVDEVYTVGGAQAVAALAYGTDTLPRVDKIVGPGNRYVAEAKRQVFGRVGIDMVAGPSEILIIADGSVDPEWVTMDLFAQAEHDEFAQAVLISPDGDYLDAVDECIARLLPTLSRRDIVSVSLKNRGALIKVPDLEVAVNLSNQLAPEHLELAVTNPQQVLEGICAAGAIFMGAMSSEALGDYCAGPNHVLPTAGSARFASPLGVYDFQRRSSVIQISSDGAQRLGEVATVLADAEALEAHGLSARKRMRDLD